MSARRRGDDIIVLCVDTAAPTLVSGKISSSWQLHPNGSAQEHKQRGNFASQVGNTRSGHWSRHTRIRTQSKAPHLIPIWLCCVFYVEAVVLRQEAAAAAGRDKSIRLSAPHIRHSGRQLLRAAPTEVTTRLRLRRPPDSRTRLTSCFSVTPKNAHNPNIARKKNGNGNPNILQKHVKYHDSVHTLMKWFFQIDKEIYCQRATKKTHFCINVFRTWLAWSCDQFSLSKNSALCLDRRVDRFFFKSNQKRNK